MHVWSHPVPRGRDPPADAEAALGSLSRSPRRRRSFTRKWEMKRGSIITAFVGTAIALALVAVMPATGLATARADAHSVAHASSAYSWPACFNYECDNQWPNNQGCD